MNSVGKNNQAIREAWIEKTLRALSPGLRILDAGAGEQIHKTMCSHLEYVSQDLGEYDGKGNGKGLQSTNWDYSDLDIVCDIAHIPEPDQSFDVILCSEVFEHLPEPILVIQEFKRLLKKGGVLILTAPFCSLTHFAPHHFYSGYNKYFFEKILKGLGFEIVELVPNGNFFEFLAQEIRRIPNIAIDYCGKKGGNCLSIVSRMMLCLLAKFSSEDRGSAEILCFGYHIKAVKNSF